ncbi:MAG TPA: EutN/CcmL family microcompartment protein [Clostridia bacterium]|nr:EutN/CcmL family microcompartment protein [Clostridia bacterium]
MVICQVIGHVWATKKEESLSGLKLMVVKEVETNIKGGSIFVAADIVGAGIGEQVLVVNGSTARRAMGKDELAVDCAIVGIIDSLEVEKEKVVTKATVPKKQVNK